MDSENDNIHNLKTSQIIGDWVPRKVVQNFFSYGNTKMSTFGSDYGIRTSKVGKRIFYNYADILRLIEESILNCNV